MSDRNEPYVPPESQIRSLFENLETLLRKFSELERFVDDNDAELREILASVSNSTHAIKTIIYGSQEFRLKGLLDRLDSLETQVREMVEARKAEKVSERLGGVETQVGQMARESQSNKDTLRGVKIGLAITGITGGGTLLTVLAEIFKP